MSTPYMGLTLPTVSVTEGPEWAEELNTAAEVIDDHDHTSGKGRPITAAALNINDDVSINNHNLTNARSYNMEDQSSPIALATDVRSLYAVMGELYYNDSIGNQVQITAGGAINASSVGGIGGDYGTSTANVYYNSTSKTFFFDQNTNQRAKLDIGDLTIRETIAAANGITLKSPSSLASSYTWTFPAALPASTLSLQVSNTGALTADYIHTAQIDPAGLGSAAYTPSSVGTTALADDSVTAAKIDPAAGIVKMSRQIFNSSPGDYPLAIPTGVQEMGSIGCGGGGGAGGGATLGNAGGGGAGAGAQVRSPFLQVAASVSHTFNPADVNTGTEFITVTAHGYAENQSLIFSTTGTLPSPLTASPTIYYAKGVTTNTFQVSTTPAGSAVNLTTQGTGVHTVESVYVVRIAAGGTGGLLGGGGQNGTSGAESSILLGATKIARFPGGKFGEGGDGGGAGTGIGGTDFTWENQSTPGGNGSIAPSSQAVAGSRPVQAAGNGGAGGGGPGPFAGGGGGGSIGNGGAGGAINVSGSSGTFGGGGGGGGGNNTAGGAGGQGYIEVFYWENVNP